ncbi:MAG TPA: ATP-binding protein [Candidatus Lokiarchaeia archaeon]|nr:ATP-binding protein [Candidatus Lokiarchaeia archaeon]
MGDENSLEERFSNLERNLALRGEFERVLFSMASRLSRHENDPVEIIVQSSLGEMSPLLGTKRIFLFLYDKAIKGMANVVEWHAEDVSDQGNIFQEIDTNNASWLYNKLREGEFIHLNDPSNAKYFPENVRKSIECLEINLMLVFPIYINIDIEGFLAFDDPSYIQDWTEEDLSFLREVIQIVGIAMDRILTEQKLKKSEEKYRSILENIKEAFFEVNYSGKFVFFNYALCNITGYSSNELMGKHYTFFVQEPDKKRVSEVFDLAQKGNAHKQNFELGIKRKDGKRLDAESTFYPKFDEQNDIIGYNGIIRDITERKKSEELRNKFTQTLEIEVRMRTKELFDALAKQKAYLDQILKSSQFKSEFMATMSHELRTPLNAIIGFSELLQEKLYGELNDKQLEFLEDIHSSAEHLLDMINRILDISKIEAGKLQLNIEPISLNEIINQVEVTFRPLYSKKDLEFLIKGLDTEKLIYADPARLKEIIMNLVSNAIKYTNSGSITIACNETSNDIEISVIDTGIGIAEKDHDRVFKEFERIENDLSPSTQGTGLGLSLTRRLVNLHGGDISFTSELGRGSTFTFTIPKKYGLQ